MHPIITFDMRKEGALEQSMQAGFEILAHCVEIGGSITGEHGVGIEKIPLMKKQFDDDTLEFMRRFKSLYDPECRLNPGKVLPEGHGCQEIRQKPLTQDNMV